MSVAAFLQSITLFILFFMPDILYQSLLSTPTGTENVDMNFDLQVICRDIGNLEVEDDPVLAPLTPFSFLVYYFLYAPKHPSTNRTVTYSPASDLTFLAFSRQAALVIHP